MKRISTAARGGRLALAAMGLLALVMGAFPAAAQAPAENVVGVYRFNSNLHVGIRLFITQQVPIGPHPNTGHPRARFEGFVENGAAQERVVGFVTGVWSSTPVSISFSRTLQNGLVQTYQGAFSRNGAGRYFMAGTFHHPGTGSPFPWMAER